MHILVTGGAGFIGSHLVDKLVKDNNVIVFDNLSSGKKEYVNPKAKLVVGDLLKDKIPMDVDAVWHLAANPEVKIGVENTKVHLEQNILATYNLLEEMRKNDVKQIYFTSTSTVYGEAKQIPTQEDYGPLIPISLYGASKLACEALITSYCHTFGMRAIIYRLANIIGARSMHGVIYDFIKKLRKNPKELEILGNGKQKKSYLHVSDCVSSMLFLAEKQKESVEIYNIGSEDWVDVNTIARIVCDEMALKPKFFYTGGKRGWVGDIPLMLLSIKKLGLKPKHNSEEAVRRSVKEILT